VRKNPLFPSPTEADNLKLRSVRLRQSRNRWATMHIPLGQGSRRAGLITRRNWLRAAALGAVGTRGPAAEWSGPAAGSADTDEKPGDEAALDEVRRRLTQAKIGPLATVRSARYVAVGDAAEGFMKLILGDCEQLAQDYLNHFKLRGFPIHPPDGPLIIVMFQDDRSFGRFFQFPSLLQAAASGRLVQPAGIYDRKSNLLHVFDWRNVPMAPRAAFRNMETLAHEGTHQLSFNTGLLRREGDTPLCIVEGLGTYGEARKISGPSEFGRLNLKRMSDLAMIQRRVPWISLRELLAQDAILRAGNAARVLLAYAQSWLLVHYLIQEADVLPRFRDYLKTLSTRQTNDHRLDDARAHLGDLDRLDNALRRYAVRLQLSVR
jgi:hypothetical protein